MAKQHSVLNRRIEFAQRSILITLIAVVVATPVALSREVLSQYTLPKFIILLAGSSLLLGLVLLHAYYNKKLGSLRSPLSLAIGAYIIALAISTLLSLDASISFFGSIARRMGLITYFCFAVCSWAVIAGVGRSGKQIGGLVWGIVFAGFVVSAYALAQVLEIAPVAKQPVVPFSKHQETFRIDAGLGHPDYAGSYLLYIVFTAWGAACYTGDKRLRIFALATSIMAAIAIVFTGTRGAWVGLLAGVALLSTLLFIEREVTLKGVSRRTRLIGGLAISGGLALAVVFIAFAEATGPVRERLMAFYTEGFTGAGRTILWRVALSMIPQYWLSGTGLEMFRVASMPYKTGELASVSGGVNPEDAHNAYLSSFISTGIVSTLVFVLLISLTLRYLLLSIRRAAQKRDKLFGMGLLSAMSAALIHNIFIFFLIPTGLYYFVFLALSYCWYRHVSEGEPPAIKVKGQGPKPAPKIEVYSKEKLLWALCGVLFLGAIIYCRQLFISDQGAFYTRVAAERCNYEQAVYYGKRATQGWLDQTDYHFYFGMALETLANRCPSIDKKKVLTEASTEVEESLGKTLMADARLLYLSELNMSLGDLDRAEQAIQSAEQIDPHTPYTHMVKAKLFLLRGEAEKANKELADARKLGGPRGMIEAIARDIKGIKKRGE
jgi:putative inorganic carbon (HCO3(-)) transporter